jgi:hypothetical protein
MKKLQKGIRRRVNDVSTLHKKNIISSIMNELSMELTFRSYGKISLEQAHNIDDKFGRVGTSLRECSGILEDYIDNELNIYKLPRHTNGDTHN